MASETRQNLIVEYLVALWDGSRRGTEAQIAREIGSGKGESALKR